MKHFLPIFLLILCVTANAQISFEKGYFINNNNERIDCYIRNVDWKNNPTKFEYKKDLNETTSLGTIANVKEFSIEGESKYKRFNVNIEKSDVIWDNLTENKNPVWQKETLFLKALEEGDASLYSYSEGNLMKFFYVTQTVAIEQLVFISYKSPDANIATNPVFRQQLFNNVKREGMGIDDFKNLQYSSNSLTKHFSKYNNSAGNKSSTYLAQKEKNILNLTDCSRRHFSKISYKRPEYFY